MHATKHADHEQLALNHTFLAIAKQRLARVASLRGAVGERPGDGPANPASEDNTATVQWHLDEATRWSTPLHDQVLNAQLASIREGEEGMGGGEM